MELWVNAEVDCELCVGVCCVVFRDISGVACVTSLVGVCM